MGSKDTSIKEIKALLEHEGGSTSYLLSKAARLANLCGDVEHETLFNLHLEGLDFDESSGTFDSKLHSSTGTGFNCIEAFYEDRILSEGRTDCRPLRQIDLWHHDLPAYAERIKAEGHLAVAAEIPQLLFELSTVLGRIHDRVADFVKRVEQEQSPHPAPAKSTLALIMKGGGIKGLAYVGALKELEKYYEFNWYIGTSAGAITAALLASGVSVNGLETILKETDFKAVLLDSSKRWLLYNLLTKGGLYPGIKFRAWIGNLINKALESSQTVHMNDLPKIPSILKQRLTVYASAKGKKAVVFDSTSAKSAGTPVNFAVRCSMSIPLLFVPESNDGSYTVDGGAQNNYPVTALLEDNPGADFIGLYLGPEIYEEKEWQLPPVLAILDDLRSIFLDTADMEALREHRDRTIIIDPRPISTLDFNLSDDEKDFLLKAGKASALKFLSRISLPNGPAVQEFEAANEDARRAREAVIALRAKRGRHWRLIRTYWLILLILLFISLFLVTVSIIWLLR